MYILLFDCGSVIGLRLISAIAYAIHSTFLIFTQLGICYGRANLIISIIKGDYICRHLKHLHMKRRNIHVLITFITSNHYQQFEVSRNFPYTNTRLIRQQPLHRRSLFRHIFRSLSLSLSHLTSCRCITGEVLEVFFILFLFFGKYRLRALFSFSIAA